MMMTYLVEEVPLEVVVIFFNCFDAVLLNEDGVVLEHLLDVFGFLLLVVGMQLNLCEVDELGGTDMLSQDPIDAEEPLAANLIIVRVV